jgi:hypothetical protein
MPLGGRADVAPVAPGAKGTWPRHSCPHPAFRCLRLHVACLQEMDRSKLDLVIAGTRDAVLMIEGFCEFLSEEQMMEVGIASCCAPRTHDCRALDDDGKPAN